MRLNDKLRLAALRSYDPSGAERDHGLDTLCNLVRLTLGVPMAAVSLVDEQTTHHLGMSGFELGDVPTDLTFCSHTIEGDVPMLVEDATKDIRFARNPFVTQNPGIRFYVGAPLIAPDGSALGALCGLDTTTRGCSEDERAKLAGLAATAVEILGMRRRVQQVRTLALTDGLTGIANRLGIELEVEKAISVSRRHGLTFSLLYFDVDRFKAINDQHGHEAGDRLLRLIGHTLAEKTRRDEVCGRLGGDEFVVLLLGATETSGMEAAQRIKSTLDDAVEQEGFPVSFSMGLAFFPQPPASPEEALSAADAGLYQAKRTGKDRIISSCPLSAHPGSLDSR